jgi:FkbM family methyltransferase
MNANDLRPRPADDGLFTAAYLQSLGFQAQTIFDIGVRRGTPQLYDAFPDRDFILVDPQKGGRTLLQHQPKRFRFVNKGLGSKPGTLFLNENAAMSSFLERTPLTAAPIKATYEVEITTLDDLIATMPSKRPLGLKIDTEGYELEVLRGLTKYWTGVEFIICEATVRQRFIGSYQFAELIYFLANKGFAFFNILNGLQARPRFYDVLFVKVQSELLK